MVVHQDEGFSQTIFALVDVTQDNYSNEPRIAILKNLKYNFNII